MVLLGLEASDALVDFGLDNVVVSVEGAFGGLKLSEELDEGGVLGGGLLSSDGLHVSLNPFVVVCDGNADLVEVDADHLIRASLNVDVDVNGGYRTAADA